MSLPLHGLTFGAPLRLWALLLVPALLALFLWMEQRADARLRKLIRAPRLRAQLTAAASTGRRRGRHAFLLLGLGALAVSLALPRLGYEKQPVRRQGLDLMIVVDVSKSMLATDVPPTRLTRAKLTVQDAVRLLTGDRLGLIAFAGTAFLQAPLTIDYDAVLTATNELDVDLIPRGGTNLGAAINLAIEAFGKAEASNRAIILLSDGEPTTDDEQADGIKAAQAAAAVGVKIFAVGFGSTEGSLIPLDDRPGEFVRQDDGQLVRTKLDAANLTELAKAANGFYVPFTNGEATMRTVIQSGLGKVKTAEIDARENSKPIERYQWPLCFALVCLAASALIGERRGVRAPAAEGAAPGVRAVPVPRRTPGGPDAPAPAATAAAAAALVLLAAMAGLAATARGADDAAASSPQQALDLYNRGKYDEAYKAFSKLAEKDPKKGNLQFDAGSSAYKSKQYDEAVQAFGNALGTDDPRLQAQAQYNFGNTLFRHGQEQKNRETKLGDWRDAIKHYNDALNYLKTHPDEALAKNTEYNRDVVQKHLDEETKEKEKQDQQKQQDQQKKDRQQQQDKNQQDKNQKQDKNQPQDKSDQKDQQKQGDGQPGNGSSDKNQQGNSQQQRKDQGEQQQQQQQQSPSGNSQDQGGRSEDRREEQKGDEDKQKDEQRRGDKGDRSENAPPAREGSQTGEKPDPNSIPKQDEPRQRGDFQAQPDQGDEKEGEKDEKAEMAQLAQDGDPGKMTAGQARALLDSLKGEDDRINLNRDRRSREDQVRKDW